MAVTFYGSENECLIAKANGDERVVFTAELCGNEKWALADNRREFVCTLLEQFATVRKLTNKELNERSLKALAAMAKQMVSEPKEVANENGD